VTIAEHTVNTVPARAGNDAGPARAPRAPRPRARWLRRLVPVAVVGALVGAAAARFAADPSPAAVGGTAPAAVSPAEQLATLQARTRTEPKDLDAWQQLGTLYVRNAVRTGDPSLYGAAAAAFDRADALSPGATRTLLGRGLLDLTLHKFSDARDLGARAHAADPYDADALAILVDASVETGRYDDAAAFLQDMLDVRPGLAALSRVSYLRELHGDVPGALDAMRRAETAGSGASFDQASVISLEGDIEFNHGNVDGAGRDYVRALAISPDVVLAQLGQARVAAARGDYDSAISALTALTARYPLPAAVSLLGDLQTVTGRGTDAGRSVDLVRTIFTLQRSSGAVVDLESAVFEADHGGTDAVELAQAALAERPTVYAADAMTWALVQAGRAADALPYLAQALRLGTADASVHYHAAVAYADTGDAARAATELTQAFAINPWFSFLHRAAATALAARLGVPLPAAWSGR
jgi:tetratricopeptide (TPR) repeat protein